MVQKRKKTIHVTPEGVALWPKLNEPDTKFDDDGVYTIKLCLSHEEAAPLIETFDQLAQEKLDEVVAEAKNVREKKKCKLASPAYQMEEDEEGNETGNVTFNFKMKASGTTKAGKNWTRTCPVFDAKQKPINLDDVQIGGGSVVKVAYEAFPFYTAQLGAGVSLRLEAVQVIDLKQYGEKSADAFGFGMEDGFEATEEDSKAEVFGGEGGEEEDEGDF